MHTQVVLFDGFDPLDVVAPFEVLSAGADVLDDDGPDRPTVELVAAEGPRTVVGGTGGLALTATARLEPDRPGVVLVPGASGPLAEIPQRLADTGSTDLVPLMRTALGCPDVVVATVCGGSLLLAVAGLVPGRRVTTHVLGVEALEQTSAQVVRARVVDDGDLVSGGGVTSGLDVGLYLLERFHGPRVAHAVEILFEYERRGVVWSTAGRAPAVGL